MFDSLHVAMFGSLLILAASILFLIQTADSNSAAEIKAREPTAEPAPSSPEAEHKYIHYALWSASTTLALVLACMTSIALLNQSLDKPKTLLINSRWIRLAPRIPAMAAIVCLPLLAVSMEQETGAEAPWLSCILSSFGNG